MNQGGDEEINPKKERVLICKEKRKRGCVSGIEKQCIIFLKQTNFPQM